LVLDSHIESRSGYREETQKRIQDYLQGNDVFRREVQRVVIYDASLDGGPWMAIVHELSRALPGLSLNVEDAVFFLNEIAQATTLTAHQVALWGDLVRAMGRSDRHDENLKRAIALGIQQHSELASSYEEITRPPTRDYEAEERKRQSRYKAKQHANFRLHREQFAKDIGPISSGQHVGALVSLAKGYLGRYSELDNSADPFTRLKEWVGEEIAGKAVQGFIMALMRNDLPNLEKICAVRAEGKHWTIEPVRLSGVAEIVRSGRSLDEVPESVVRAVLGIWWDMPEFHSTKLGEDVEKALEEVVLRDDQRAEEFVTTVIESQFALGKQHVSGLYRFLRDPHFLIFSPKLAIKWLEIYPKASYSGQLELLQFLLQRSDLTELVALVHKRANGLDLLKEDCQRLWTAAAFCIAPFAMADKFDNAKLLPKE